MNLNSRLKKIESRIKNSQLVYVIAFSDGERIETTEKKIQAMFDSAMNGEPNELAKFFYQKFDKGHEDVEGGLIHLLNAYRVDPVALWENNEVRYIQE